MKPLTILLPLIAAIGLHAQTIRYETDEQCGCDIIFVDGIETTKTTLPDGTTLYGFRREDGTVLTNNTYKYVDRFQDGYCRVWIDDNLCGLIDTNGRQIVPCLFNDVKKPSENRILVIKDGLCGYTNLNGQLVIPTQYPQAAVFTEQCAAVTIIVDSVFYLSTFIDTNGNQLFPPVFEMTTPFSNGYAPVLRYSRWGIIDHQGNEVLPTIYEGLTAIHNGLFFAGDSSGLALFDLSMKPLTPFIYHPISTISENRIPVLHNGKYGFLDPKGHETIPCIYDHIGIFQQGRAMACIEDSCGIIDTNGNTILPLTYENKQARYGAYSYSDNLALVEKNGMFGYVNLHGELVIKPFFNNAFSFSQGLAPVKTGHAWGYIDTLGNIFIPFIFDHASPFQHGRAEVIYNGQTLTIDRTGRCVKNCNGIIAFRDPEP